MEKIESRGDIEIEEILTRERKRTIQKKIGAKKEFIEESDLAELIVNMKLTISNEDLKTIFTRLDIEKKGKVSLDTLIENIKKEESEDNTYSQFFKKMGENLTTKSELIITKLKKLKQKANDQKDIESVEDIDWLNFIYLGL